MIKRIGIDVGATTVRVSAPGMGILLSVPAVIAYAGDGYPREPLAYGSEALSLASRTPGSVILEHPFGAGSNVSASVLGDMIRYLIRGKHLPERVSHSPLIAIATPGEQNSDTEALCNEVGAMVGAGDCYPIDTLLAAACGACVDQEDNVGIVQIGATACDSAVLNRGEMIHYQTSSAAGDAFDAAIAGFVARQFHVALSPEAAEQVKLAIGSFLDEPETLSTVTAGLRSSLGLPREVELRSADILPGLEAVFDDMSDSLLKLLDSVRYRPELLVLTGGSAGLRGLDIAIEQLTQIPTRIAPEPENCVALGIAQLLQK